MCMAGVCVQVTVPVSSMLLHYYTTTSCDAGPQGCVHRGLCDFEAG
jgi:hypothetical protein